LASEPTAQFELHPWSVQSFGSRLGASFADVIVYDETTFDVVESMIETGDDVLGALVLHHLVPLVLVLLPSNAFGGSSLVLHEEPVATAVPVDASTS
jgi:hypothetical protein